MISLVSAVVAAAIAVLPAVQPAASPLTMVYVDGWYHVGPASIHGEPGMIYADPAAHIAFTIDADSYVDVYFGGGCSSHGVARRSTPTRHVTCHG